MFSDDYGSGQESEMYLYEQQKLDRKRREEERRQEQERRERERRREENARLLGELTFRFYDRTYSGKAALVAAIIDKLHNPPRATYGRDLVDRTVSAMSSQSPSPDLSPTQARDTDNSYRRAVSQAYQEAVEATSGKTDTQLGLMADYVTYN